MNNFFENSNKNNYVKQRSQFIINPTNYQDKYKNYNNIKPELKENVVVVKLKENKDVIFLENYDTTISEIFKNRKMEFRYICYKYLTYIRNIMLPPFPKKSIYEAVLIEYRKFPHLEFLIRNMILKLGSNWSHTIICGTNNYTYMVDMCKSISPNINIIETKYDNLTPSDYSLFLSSLEFWNLLNGEKVLIYQEDSIIFKKNINDFIHFDYIGASWCIGQDDNKSGVGNGGFSLRTKSIMEQIINTIGIQDTQFNSSTITYCVNTNSHIYPEDVYFSKNIEDLHLGLIATRESGNNFSSETTCSKDSLGGHNFWLNDESWKERIFTNNIIQFIPTYTNNPAFYEHRGGWKYVIDNLVENKLYSEKSNINFFDMIEHKFMFEREYVCDKKWCGIFHCTPITPDYLNIINIENVFLNINFINSLNKCLFMITLSPYLTKYLNKRFTELKQCIKIYTLKHPVVFDESIPLFNINKFIQNKEKTLIQLGQQLRIMSTIYRVDAPSEYKKMWLTGTKNIEKCKDLLQKEFVYLNINKEQIDESVKVYYTKTFEEYDELLSKNIILINLFDATANNSVIECIVRNTPLLINKIEGVVNYLGDNYPLYFTNISQIPKLLTIQNIKNAHTYLSQMNKSDLTIKYFMRQLYTIIHNNIDNPKLFRITIVVQIFVKYNFINDMINNLLLLKNINKYNVIFWQDSLKNSKYYDTTATTAATATITAKTNDYIKNHEYCCQTIMKNLSKFKHAEYKQNDNNEGPYKTCKVAMDYAFSKSEYVILLEDDVMVSSNFLSFFEYNINNNYLNMDKKNLFITGESIFFDSKRKQYSQSHVEHGKRLINKYKLNTYYTLFDFFTSSCFCTSDIIWEKIIKDKCGNPCSDVELCHFMKENSYSTIFPVVPLCRDIGMTNKNGYSYILHGENVTQIKNTYLLDESNNHHFTNYPYNRDKLFDLTCNLSINERNCYDIL